MDPNKALEREESDQDGARREQKRESQPHDDSVGGHRLVSLGEVGCDLLVVLGSSAVSVRSAFRGTGGAVV